MDDLGRAGIRAAYETGRGSIVMRGKVAFETIRKEREAIVITEIPYQVNKAAMVERIAELVREKKIDGIADLRDESDREGYRVVIELKRDAERDVVLNQLYRYTPLQSSFGANMVALDGGRPLLLLGVLFIFTGIQLITLGLLAEMQARTYHESQDKPIYTIREIRETTEDDVGRVGRR